MTLTALFLLVVAIWPFSSTPVCGVNSTCVPLREPVYKKVDGVYQNSTVSAGVLRDVKAVYRNKKKLSARSFRMIAETSLGPKAVQVDLVKTDTTEEELMFVYR